MGKHRPEPAHARAAFERYIEQNTPRSLKKLAADLGRPYRTVAQWAQWYDWRARAMQKDLARIDAVARERQEERHNALVLKNFYRALRLTMVQYVESVKKRQESGVPVRENDALLALKCIGIMHKDYADQLAQPDE